MEAEPAFEVARSPLVLGVGRDQRGIEVERDPLRCRFVAPGSLAGPPARLVQHPQPFWRDRLDDPLGGRPRRHLAKQVRVLAQHAQVGQAVTAIGDAHDQVAQHPTRIVG